MKYINEKGVVIDVNSEIRGEGWRLLEPQPEPVDEDKPTPKKGKRKAK